MVHRWSNRRWRFRPGGLVLRLTQGRPPTMRERIFKGSTRPAMVAGVPIMVFVPVAILGAIATLWSAVLASIWLGLGLGAGAALVLLALNLLSRRDDQRLLQALLATRLRLRSRNRRLWHARSYAPHVLRGQRDDFAR